MPDVTACAHLVYFHGFGSGPGSAKAQLLQTQFADHWHSSIVPDLEGGDFYNLTMPAIFARARAALAKIPDDGAPILVAGSSLGGYTAATVLAEDQPQRVAGALLLAPAFGFTERWRTLLGDDGVNEWHSKGERDFYHHAAERELPLASGFLASCEVLPPLTAPTHCPTIVVHGRQDESVDIAWSRRWAEQAAHLELIELDSDHSLTDPLSEATILAAAKRLLDAIAG